MSDIKDVSNNSDSENLCVVCCKNVEIYSIGVCDHPVCFECSTRMRVLCNQNECPICRGQMPKVIFTRIIKPFTILSAEMKQTYLQERRYGLIFHSDDIKKAYQILLEYRCSICSKNATRKCTFYNFQQLKDHMRKEHNLVYCDLCVENLKIFAFERRCYTKQELGHHRRKGDPDNTSHRGHPLCEFCDTRFMDSDELFRHLRRNHLFCHYCDADGKHQYYKTLEDLCTHFREEHFLCQEGECNNNPLVAVFRTEIDLKAHISSEHGRYLSKSAHKQARTLELEFTLAPRPGSDRNRNRPTSVRNDEEGAVGYEAEPGGPGGGSQPALTAQDFPALGNANTAIVQSRPTTTTVNFTSRLAPFSGEDFPSLGGGRTPAVAISTDSTSRKKTPGVTITRTLRGSGGSAQNLKKNSENFPCLGPPSSSTVHLSVNNNGQSVAPNVSIHVSRNGTITTTHITSTSSNNFNVNQRPVDAFPALGGVSTPIFPQWVQQKSKVKQEPKPSKVAPAPILPPSDLSQFPILSKNKNEKNAKISSSVTVPVSGSWASPSSSSSATINSKNSNNNTCNNNNRKINKNTMETSVKLKTKKPNKKNNNNESDNQNLDKQNIEENKDMNGTVKKRSELKIGSLSVSDGTKPPPGFPVKPPPGFTSFNNQNFPSLSNDLTFTSSSGQSYAITPINYHQPPNFNARNQNLIKRSMSLLDSKLIPEFKSYSGMFRDGTMPAERYYEYCKAVLGKNFNELFPELLVLLPDINKQQELFQVCDEEAKRNLLTCENCKQVVFKKELREHYNYHTLESQFPSLGNVDSSNAWKK